MYYPHLLDVISLTPYRAADGIYRRAILTSNAVGRIRCLVRADSGLRTDREEYQHLPLTLRPFSQRYVLVAPISERATLRLAPDVIAEVGFTFRLPRDGNGNLLQPSPFGREIFGESGHNQPGSATIILAALEVLDYVAYSSHIWMLLQTSEHDGWLGRNA